MAALKNYKFDLKAKYYRTLNICFIISLLLLISAFQFSPEAKKVIKLVTAQPEFPPISSTDPTYQKPKVPPPPQKPRIIEASIDDLGEDIFMPDVSIDENQVVPPPRSPDKNTEDDNWVHEFAEKMPEPIGGMNAIGEKIYYTEIAKRIGLEGKVFIEAIVDKNGNVIEAVIIKKLGGGLDEIALNAIYSTKFHPAEQMGKPVKVKLVIPVHFILN